ncbi:MAG: hypothetical protein H6607_06700 [Flavobacteriales bacterium]|nr:hypothetical protein [Flavobacteriales bacterium]
MEQSFQEKFVDYLKKSVSVNVLLADELAEVLAVSKDSAYRRLRSETPFTIDEAMKVCSHFKLDLSLFFNKLNQSITFKFNKLYDLKGGFEQYLSGIKNFIDYASKTGGKIIYAAEDVPIFHHFDYPALATFKLFYWQKAVLNESSLVGQRFRKELIHPDTLKSGKDLLESYNNIESTEIWTEESVNSTLRQILYMVESGQFESFGDAEVVLHEVRQMMSDLQQKAEKASKLNDSSKQNLTIYNSEVLIGNNCILVEHPEVPTVFISHNTFNSLSTTDADFCSETSKWMQNLIRKSTLITDVSETHRYRFFKKINAEIDGCQKAVERMGI